MARAGTAVAHRIMKLALAKGHRRFSGNLDNLEVVQREQLQRILAGVATSQHGQEQGMDASWRWEDFSQRLPVTDYRYWEPLIQQQQKGGGNLLGADRVSRYQPTSGSTSSFKLIPYTAGFLSELDSAIAPWIYQLYCNYPTLKNGRHYWSLSWLPDSRRELMTANINDDLKILSPLKQFAARVSQSVPQSVSMTDHIEDSFFATIAWLLATSDLTMLSVWSPTFAIRLLDEVKLHREELVDVLIRGRWGKRECMLSAVPAPHNARAARILQRNMDEPEQWLALWPKLQLVSSWDTAMSAYWAKVLQSRISHSGFEGKGLWATEGVVTIPWQGKYPLAYCSHVYEFEDVSSQDILPPWKLDKGQVVKPVITSGNGLLRYRMNDLLEVNGHIGSVPCFEFQGRDDGVDMVGEKMSASLAQHCLDELSKHVGTLPVTLLAVQGSGGRKPGYVALLEKQEKTAQNENSIATVLDNILSQNFHYELARNLGQLERARCVFRDNARHIYTRMCLSNGMIEGDIKFEPLKICHPDYVDDMHSV